MQQGLGFVVIRKTHMNKYIKFILSYILFISSSLHAVSVEDNKGKFSIDYTPKRVVVLEFSFVDSLALIDIKPVGIADDNQSHRLFSKLRDKIGTYTSVGTRAQPSLEVIASLKPDLIIADIRRHESVYESLNKIAPTLMLASKRSSYLDSFLINKKIAKVLGKEKQMQIRLEEHKQYMKEISKKLPLDLEIQVSTAKENSFFLSTHDSYIAEVIKALNIKYPISQNNNDAPRYASLEQLLAMNPQYLIVAEKTKPSIIDKWKKKTLWKMLKCAEEGHVISVEANLWSRSRGILSSEQIAEDLLAMFRK